jgi:large subunit ribosomal protein L15
MPIQRRLPKFGFHQYNKVVYQVVNVSELERLEKIDDVTPEVLRDNGLIKSLNVPVKILGNGEISRKVNVKVHAISKSAQEKIEKSGGGVTLL